MAGASAVAHTDCGSMDRAQAASACNIDYRSDYLDDVELRRLQNESLFHLCPSETEGWGHYLVEP
jgi:hypothetical protein